MSAHLKLLAGACLLLLAMLLSLMVGARWIPLADVMATFFNPIP